MEKNTVWAIVLSVIILIGSAILIPVYQANQLAKNGITEPVAVEQQPETKNTVETNTQETLSASENVEEVTEEPEEEIILTEEKKVIRTNVAEIEFTSKGGDILSYKLIKHNDIDTNDYIQLADNISDINRTCALSFGGSTTPIDNTIYVLETEGDINSETQKIIFTANKKFNGKSYIIRKEYTLVNNEYLFKLDVKIHGDPVGLDFNGATYTLRTSPQIGPYFNQKRDRYEVRQFLSHNGKKIKKVPLATDQFKKYEKDTLWGGIAGKYFEQLVIPVDSTIIGNIYYSTQVEVNNYQNAQAFFERRSYTGTDISDTYYMYFGPRNEKEIKIYNVSDKNYFKISGRKLTESINTSGWLSWLEAILKWCLETLHKIISNYGVCIIVLTFILKLLMFPISKKQSLSTLKMQELQPKIQVLQKKYANDQQKLQAEMSKVYQEAGYNPLSGCLPLLFQFLILWAMFNLFNNYFDFRGSVFIKGWIPDLTKGDSVYTFKKAIPLLGTELRILPIIYVGTQILSSKITQMQNVSNNGSKGQMILMTYGLPIFFFFMFYSASSGLLLFWLTSNILSIIQQIIINKMMKNKKKEMAVTENKIVKKSKK